MVAGFSEMKRKNDDFGWQLSFQSWSSIFCIKYGLSTRLTGIKIAVDGLEKI